MLRQNPSMLMQGRILSNWKSILNSYLKDWKMSDATLVANWSYSECDSLNSRQIGLFWENCTASFLNHFIWFKGRHWSNWSFNTQEKLRGLESQKSRRFWFCYPRILTYRYVSILVFHIWKVINITYILLTNKFSTKST